MKVRKNIILEEWMNGYLLRFTKYYDEFNFSETSRIFLSLGIMMYASLVESEGFEKDCAVGVDKIKTALIRMRSGLAEIRDVHSVMADIYFVSRKCSECLEATRPSKKLSSKKTP